MGAQFALINGAACRYSVSGQGDDTLVLVHELAGSLNSWDEFVGLMPDDVRIVRYDLRGAGMSEKLKGTQDYDTLADDIAALVDHLGISGTVDVMGAAAGAGVAVRFATRHADRIGRLVLLAPALTVPEDRRAGGRETADRVEKEGMRAVADIVLPQAFPGNLWRDDRQKATALARWHGADPEGYAAMYRALNNHGVIGDVEKIACPTLVLAGEHDPFNRPDRLSAIADRIPDCRFEVIDAGHFAAVQSPQTLPAVVTGFLAYGP
ncbi:alpha/beta fold hydrolase [Microbaculum marinum]|uniref:Alpha/beta fold hydrolase n=1 Tax=Microbaculum marinum TaxID=1764581 RepID=A0AAW9RXQ9_9HYPH